MSLQLVMILLTCGGTLVGAGIAWGLSQGSQRYAEKENQETRKQLNGLGGVVRRLQDAILLQVPKEQQKEMIWFLRGGGGQP
jgi:hypothetical protein